MKYVVESKSGGIVMGLGVFEEGETRELTQDEVDQFKTVAGVQLNDAALPEGFAVTIVIGEGE